MKVKKDGKTVEVDDNVGKLLIERYDYKEVKERVKTEKE